MCVCVCACVCVVIARGSVNEQFSFHVMPHWKCKVIWEWDTRHSPGPCGWASSRRYLFVSTAMK